MKILVCGFGSIGQKHARNLKTLGADVKIWRKSGGLAESFETISTLEEGLTWCDGAVITNATNEHIPLARKIAKARKPFYLEKPVSSDDHGVDDLAREAEDLVVEVGCQMRRHPNLLALRQRLEKGEDGAVLAFQAWVGQRLDQWRPGTDYRQSYSADSKRGGGALFDLVHEIDLMTWLAGPMTSVYADLRQNSDLEMKAEDLANLLLVTESGAAGTVQLDMLSPAYRRGLQIICAKAVYKWDMKEGKLWRDDGEDAVCVDEIPAGYQPAQMLADTMNYFLERIKTPSLPASCSLAEGIHDLKILLAARELNKTGRKQTIGKKSTWLRKSLAS